MKKLKLLCIVLVVYAKTVSGSIVNTGANKPQKSDVTTGGSLYPRATETREVNTLDGIWNFRQSPGADHDAGYKHEWFKQDLAQVNTYLLRFSDVLTV